MEITGEISRPKFSFCRIFFNFVFSFAGQFFFCTCAFLFSKKKSQGQAAITDAVFFLLIVTGLCVFLFSFSSTYANSTFERFSLKYSNDFAVNSIKSIIYSSVSRNGVSIYNADPNSQYYDQSNPPYIDSFLAFLKEKYAASLPSGVLESKDKLILAETVFRVLRPIASSEDFLFIIFEKGALANTPVLVIAHFTNDLSQVSDSSPQAHSDFICSPVSGFLLADRISSFSMQAGVTSQYFTSIRLFSIPQSERGISAAPKNGIILLMLWKGKPLGETGTSPESVMDKFRHEWGCRKLKFTPEFKLDWEEASLE